MLSYKWCPTSYISPISCCHTNDSLSIVILCSLSFYQPPSVFCKHHNVLLHTIITMIYFKNFLIASNRHPAPTQKSLSRTLLFVRRLEASGQCSTEGRAQSRPYPGQSIPCKPNVPDCRSAKSFPLHFPPKGGKKKRQKLLVKILPLLPQLSFESSGVALPRP